MIKYIVIEACNKCPEVNHTGAFTKGGAKPCCNHDSIVESKGYNYFDRVIPNKRRNNGDIKIPKWCPLDTLNTN